MDNKKYRDEAFHFYSRPVCYTLMRSYSYYVNSEYVKKKDSSKTSQTHIADPKPLGRLCRGNPNQF